MSTIEIRQGDEYRARIGKVSEKEAFFHEVYQEALGVLGELVDHADQNRPKEEKDGRQYRIGNNIIAFCGHRGQGKTSAMQTFSYYLRDAEKDVLGGKKFYVLSSIDPSSLRSEESIIRVMISKLFNEATVSIENYYKDNADEDAEDRIRSDRSGLMQCFENCFHNVDYSVKENKDDFGMDDLELLNQLGSSNKLRKNLEDLVKKFLDFQSRYGKKGEYNFLIIQIDDSDMALDGVFKMCEDIRNYFSLPNVIVFMAADIKQLTNAITQEYIKKYHELITTSKAFLHDTYLKDCEEMGSRYVEKMFPFGHRMELPEMESFIKSKFKTLKLVYKDIEERDLFAEYAEQCSDIQEQLLRALYERTGLIFFKHDFTLHDVLPKTIRELTHFVKMLRGMPVIDFERAYVDKCQDTKNLLHNLDIMEQYFWNFWCKNNLTKDELIIIEKSKDDAIYDEGNMQILPEIEKNIQNSFKLRSAYSILYSILVNSRFAECVGKREAFTSLADSFRNAIIERCDILKVSDIKEIAKNKVRSSTRIGMFKLQFLSFRFGEGPNTNTGAVDAKSTLAFCKNIAKDNWKFDIPGTMLNAFYEMDALINEKAADGKKELITDTSVDSSATEKGNGDLKEAAHVERTSLLIGMKNLLANYEITQCITEKIAQEFSRISLIAFSRLSEIYQNIFLCFNLDSYNIKYLGITAGPMSSVGDYWFKVYQDGRGYYSLFFWESIRERLEKQKLGSAFGDLFAGVYKDIWEKTFAEYQNVTTTINPDESNEIINAPMDLQNAMISLSSDKAFIDLICGLTKDDKIEKMDEAVEGLLKQIQEYNVMVKADSGENSESREKKALEIKNLIQEQIKNVQGK